MKANEAALGTAEDEPVPPTSPCPDCDQSFKTAQGLAGHRRLAHSASTAHALEERTRELDEHRRALETKTAEIARRETAARRRETEVTRRRQEIDATGPSSIGLAQCGDCGGWFDNKNNLRSHSQAVHPLDEKVAAEIGVGRGRVNEVWTEACRKHGRHSDETPEQIVTRFWSGTDQRILRALLDHNAAFTFEDQ